MNIVDMTNFLDERGVEYKFLTRLSIVATFKVEFDMKLIEDYLKKNDEIIGYYDITDEGFNLKLSYSETNFKRTNDEFSKWHLQFHNMTDEAQFLDNKFSLIKMCKRLKSGRMPFDYLEYTHDTDFSDEIIFDKIDKFLNQAQSFVRYMKRFEKLTKIMNIGKNTEGE